METVIFALKFEKLIVKEIEYAIKHSALLVANQSKKTPFQRHRKKIIEETIWKIRIWFPEWAHTFCLHAMQNAIVTFALNVH